MKGIDVIVEQGGSRYHVAVVRVLGQIDTTTSHELERRLQYLLKDHQFDIVIDLSKVTYISSAGWGIFISEIRGIRESGGDLKLAGMPSDVAEVFELLEFHNILESYRTVEAAVETFERNRMKTDSQPGAIEAAGADADTATYAAGAADGTSEPEEDLGETGGIVAAAADAEVGPIHDVRPAETSGAVEDGKPAREGAAVVSVSGENESGAKLASQGIESVILEIVRENPEYGCLRIRKELFERGYRKQLNPLAVFVELKRLDLETKEKRKQYAESVATVKSGQ
jgi:anti-sigma B factor antagonist